MTHHARRAARSALIRWMAERLMDELLAEAAAATQNQQHDHDSSHLRAVQHRPPARNLPR